VPTEQGTPGTPNQTTPPQLDWNLTVPVKVDGVEQMLSLREVANGYAASAKMHEANTRANQMEQELARYRATFDQMDSDPAAFVDKVKDHYKLTPEQGGTGSTDDINPLAATVARLEAQISQIAGSAATQEQTIAQERQLAGLASQHGEAFERDKVLAYATTKGVDNLEHAYLMMKGEQGPAQQEAGATQQTPHQEILESLMARKAASLGSVNPGATPAAGAQTEQPLGPPSSTAEALHRALAKEGTTMDGLMATL